MMTVMGSDGQDVSILSGVLAVKYIILPVFYY